MFCSGSESLPVQGQVLLVIIVIIVRPAASGDYNYMNTNRALISWFKCDQCDYKVNSWGYSTSYKYYIRGDPLIHLIRIAFQNYPLLSGWSGDASGQEKRKGGKVQEE